MTQARRSGAGPRAALALALLTLAGAGAASARAQDGLVARLAVDRASATLEGSTDPSERRAAARFLGRHGAAERAAAALATAIVVETERDVRIEIADALARRGLPVASAAIAERLGSAPDEERNALLRALGAAHDERALEALALELGSASDGALAADLLVAAGALARSVLVAALSDASRRAAALGALGRIGDRTTAGDVAALLSDDDAPVRASAARALAMLGDPDGVLPDVLATADDALAGAILRAFASEPEPAALVELTALAEARLGSAEPSTRAGALLFLAAHAPERAAEPLLSSLEGTPEVRATVRDALGASRASALVPVAGALALRSDAGSAAHDVAIDFLARAVGGAGLGTLLELEAAPLALALALRRAAGAPAWQRTYETLLRRSSDETRDLFSTLAGVARGPSVASVTDPRERAAAAARAWLAPEVDHDLIASALEGESDARVFSWLARAAVAHHVAIGASELRAWLERPERRADALALVPSALGRATPRDARLLRSALSRALLSPHARERATAAQALGLLHAEESGAALEALLGDASDTVRVAAARALVALEPERAAAVVLAEARAAHDPATARTLLDALKPDERPDVLVVEVALSDDAAITPWLEVRTCDGTWLRLPALPGGVVVIPDVPCSHVEADLVL